MRIGLALLVACAGAHPPDAGTDGGPDGGPAPMATNTLDLLFVVDGSPSAVFDRMPELFGYFRAGDGGGFMGWVPYASVHFAIVTTDLDRGVPGCEGGGALMRMCGERFYEWRQPDPIDEAALACALPIETDCDVDQPLESALEALSVSAITEWTAIDYRAPRSAAHHGDAENEGFLRPGSILAIVVIGATDDCSVNDAQLYDPYGGTYGGGELALRCALHPGALHSIDRFVEGLTALRRDPSRLAYFVIGGVPSDLSGTDVSYILTHDRLRQRIGADGRLVPSCNTAALAAEPPVRLLHTALALRERGAHIGAASICQDDSFLLAQFLMQLPR